MSAIGTGAPWGCTSGPHVLSPVEELADDRAVYECIACDREFVQEPDGTLTPVVEASS